MAQPHQLSKQELRWLSQGLADCSNVKEDLARAELAGVPNIEHVREAVDTCEERINKLLATYNPKGRK